MRMRFSLIAALAATVRKSSRNVSMTSTQYRAGKPGRLFHSLESHCQGDSCRESMHAWENVTEPRRMTFSRFPVLVPKDLTQGP
jgi:hypothetical protein